MGRELMQVHGNSTVLSDYTGAASACIREIEQFDCASEMYIGDTTLAWACIIWSTR